MKLFGNTLGFTAAAALACLASAPQAGAAEPYGPTWFAIQNCANGQWEQDGFSSYAECAHIFWDLYCSGVGLPGDPLEIGDECAQGNPF